MWNTGVLTGALKTPKANTCPQIELSNVTGDAVMVLIIGKPEYFWQEMTPPKT